MAMLSLLIGIYYNVIGNELSFVHKFFEYFFQSRGH